MSMAFDQVASNISGSLLPMVASLSTVLAIGIVLAAVFRVVSSNGDGAAVSRLVASVFLASMLISGPMVLKSILGVPEPHGSESLPAPEVQASEPRPAEPASEGFGAWAWMFGGAGCGLGVVGLLWTGSMLIQGRVGRSKSAKPVSGFRAVPPGSL